MCEIQITYDNDENLEFSVELPLDNEKICFLAGAGPKILRIMGQSKTGMYSEFYICQKIMFCSSIL